jgi:outer membrane protein OmpA-like peptidoglycan-associated protein
LEIIVRQPIILFFSGLAGLGWSLSVSAVSFQTRLEKVQWQVTGDKFECRLSQSVTDFGSGVFVRRAGEQAIFRLQADESWLGKGAAVLLAAAAPWQPEHSDMPLGIITAAGGGQPLNSNQEQAGRLLTALLAGRSPLLRHRTWNGAESLEVRLLPVRFRKAYEDYLACTAKLLPVNFEQIRQSTLGFPDGGVALDLVAKARLDVLLDFMKADPTVNHVELDGHSDSSGNRLTNRDLSRRRALAVMDYLKAHGVAEERIVMRFHGERYPLVPNNSAVNRAQNRRVLIRLERDPEPVSKPAEQAPAVESEAPPSVS